jgi:hypothetical protein
MLNNKSAIIIIYVKSVIIIIYIKSQIINNNNNNNSDNNNINNKIENELGCNFPNINFLQDLISKMYLILNILILIDILLNLLSILI